MRKNTVVIIGAGVMGCCMAFELAKKKIDCCLIENETGIFRGASGHNPGKCHFGFHYPGARNDSTIEHLLAGYFSFIRSYPHLLIKGSDESLYLVVKNSFTNKNSYYNLCTRIEELYHKIKKKYASDHSESDLSIFKILEEREYQKFVDPHQICFAVSTKEPFINIKKMIDEFLHLLSNNKYIHFLTDSKVINIEKFGDKFITEFLHHKEKESIQSDYIINCSWSSLESINSMVDNTKKNFSMRLKMIAKIKLSDNLKNMPSMCFVHGPFCEFFNLMDNTGYLSYAPCSNYLISHDNILPAQWENWISHGLDKQLQEKTYAEILMGSREFIKSIEKAELIQVETGVVYNKGSANMLDKSSDMHSRDETGYSMIVPNFYSVDTGKLVLASLYANEITQIILQSSSPSNKST